MRHSKHLILLVATLIALILAGVMYYLYLTTLSSETMNYTEPETQVAAEPERDIEALTERLRNIETPERSPEEIAELTQRLESVRGTNDRTPEEIAELTARLQAAE
jgi:flagellar biosynthesis/type III secretory pathway M-ring protein FliF/YscJ